MKHSQISPIGLTSNADLKVYYADDPDPEKAGQGLGMAPLLANILDPKTLNYWLMSPSEQMAMIYLLENLRPKIAIEIGTKFGGSLQILSKYCGKVYSLDIDPEVPNRLQGRFPNVEYLIGPSQQTLPALIERLQAEGNELSFVLVDGDHSAEGVRSDIDALLKFKPVVPLYIVMHDSFNPDCRAGLATAGWLKSPFVHAVELDFVTGTVNPAPNHQGQLWGGLALGVLKPEVRTGRLEIIGRADLTYARCYQKSILKGIKSKLKRFFQ